MISCCRLETVNGRRVFHFKEPAVAGSINAGVATGPVGTHAPTAGYHSMVQELAWPSAQDEAPLSPPAQANCKPGSSWFQEELLAHTLLHRQMLQPAIKATQLQVVHLLEASLPCKPAYRAVMSRLHHCAELHHTLCRVSSWNRATLKARSNGHRTESLHMANPCYGRLLGFGRPLSSRVCLNLARAQRLL